MSELNNIVSLFYFTPELIICFGIVSILIISVFEKLKDYSFIISLIIRLCPNLLILFSRIFPELSLFKSRVSEIVMTAIFIAMNFIEVSIGI